MITHPNNVFSIILNDKYIFYFNLMVVSRLSMYVHSVTMWNETYFYMAVYIYVKHGLGHLFNEYYVHFNSWPNTRYTI